MEYLLSQAQRMYSPIHAAIVSNSPLDEKNYEARQSSLRSALEAEMQEFYKAQDAASAEDTSVGAGIYRRLIGSSETNIVGELSDWSILD